MNTYEKTQFIINYSSSHTDEDVPSIKGWAALCYLYMNNNLSYEFRSGMEKEIDSIYDMICQANKVEKEKRIPALHVKGTLHRLFIPSTKVAYGSRGSSKSGALLPAPPHPKIRLTDEEILQIGHAAGALEGNNMLPITFARAIEEKIWEKEE